MGLFDEPITRKEMYLSYLNGNTSVKVPKPITREELYLSYLCGNTAIKLPEPITRIERYLYSLCINGGNVGGGDGGGESKPSDVEIVPFADATDAQIAAIAQALRAGTITPEQTGWQVGDERTVQLSAIESEYMGNHVAQKQTLVILHKGGKLLENGNECSFVVGLKNCLADGTTLEGFGMNANNTSEGGWNECRMRSGCNEDFVKMLSEELRPAFVKFQNITADGSGTTTKTSIDLFALPAEKEVFGTNTRANSTAEADLFQFDYYAASTSNRIKKARDNGSSYIWWERSPFSNNSTLFCYVNTNGNASYNGASSAHGLAPFGCI